MDRANIVEIGRGRTTTVSFEFPSNILDVIKHPSMYVKLDLLVIRGLESKHSNALYEVMKDYQGIGNYTISIEAFKVLMGIEADQYKIFTMFRKRVVDKAIQEINTKTDINLQYQLIKEGRRIVAFHFKISQNPQKKFSGSGGTVQSFVFSLER